MGVQTRVSSTPNRSESHEEGRQQAYVHSGDGGLLDPPAPLVSIIINNYNYGRFLPDAIASALRQTYERVEVLVVDDGSTDHSREVMTSYGDQIIPILKENGGQASAQPGTVVFAGGFSHPPNVDAALWLGREIMPLLCELHPGIQLTLVGSYPPDEVQTLAGDDIVVTGRVPEIEPYLERAALVLAPVRIGGGMRTKVLQGMGMGKVVVTTPLGAEGLTGPSEPPLVVAADAYAFARETARLLTSDGERRALGHRARSFVAEHYSAAAYVRRLELVYAELCSQSGEFQTCGLEERRLSV
jgi:glycosyltransferase involved in cell wall biosynthesis